MPKTESLSDVRKTISPDYVGLVKFLMQPFLEVPDSLEVDCEQIKQNQKVWLRVAFEASDKGKVFGRGGRNIQAIRTVLQTAAAIAGQSLYLDIYSEGEKGQSNGGSSHRQDRDRHSNSKPKRNRSPRRRKTS